MLISLTDPKQNSSLAAPAYRAPPGYYTPAVTALQMAAGQTVSMQDKQQPAMPVSNGSTAVNKLPRNGSNQNIAYSQVIVKPHGHIPSLVIRIIFMFQPQQMKQDKARLTLC